jgi:membrane protein
VIVVTDRAETAGYAPSTPRTPLWALAAGAAMILLGLGRREAAAEPSRGGTARQPIRADDARGARRGGSRPVEREDHRSSGDTRGRAADTPSEIPAAGWKDILLRIYRSISEDRIVAISAGVTFYALLAIFPAIAAMISLYGLFADPATINQHVETLTGFVPGGGLDIIREQIDRVVSQGRRTLGLTLVTGLAISLWSANAGIKALFDALNVVYHEEEKRGFFKLNAVSLAFTLGAIVFLLLAIAVMTVLPALLEGLGLSGASELLITIGRWPALLVTVSFAIPLIYRYGPSRDEPQWRWITWGSAFAAVGWLVASMLFSWYAENFGSYNTTYGSLGAVIGFMTWVWISAIVILVGAKINAEMEHQTARDTTTGAPEPLGRRGAHMADTVGAAQA